MLQCVGEVESKIKINDIYQLLVGQNYLLRTFLGFYAVEKL